MKGFTAINEVNKVFDSATERQIFVNGVDQPKYKAIWNETRGHVSAIASNKYNLVAHQDVFNAVKDALANLNLNTSVKIRDGGDRMQADVVFEGRDIEVAKGEVFAGGFRLINSYNKTTGVIIQPCLVRLACLNGMVASEIINTGFSVHHSNKMVLDFERSIPKLINDLAQSNEKIKSILNTAIGDSIEWQLLDKLLEKFVHVEKHRKNIYSILARDCKGDSVSRWDLYNAFTNYATHGQQLKISAENLIQRKAQEILKTDFETLLKITPEVV